MILNRRQFVYLSTAALPALASETDSGSADILLENEHYSLAVDRQTGALRSLLVKRNGAQLIGEPRLAANFRICLPLPDYQCNYLDGITQKPAEVTRRGNSIQVRFTAMAPERGDGSLDLSYSISLREDCVVFQSELTNRSRYPVSEFWFPRLGGWTGFGGRDAALATPNYASCGHETGLFRNYPGSRGLGADAAEFTTSYPGMTMPWWSIHDQKHDTGLYLGYHDPTLRLSVWHTYLYPDTSGNPEDRWIDRAQAAGQPVGLVFSHVRFPNIKDGETFHSGEFIIRAHTGDWRAGSGFYRKWLLGHFPFDKSSSWLRRQHSWFTSILYQPEDRLVANYKQYDKWCRDAEQYGVRCQR